MAKHNGGDGIAHGDHEHDSMTSVTDCILGLRSKIDDKDLPGFTSLIDDWFSPEVNVDEEHFVQRFLRVFKQSDKDFTYEKIVADYDNEVQGIVNDFVDGKISAQAAAERYSPVTSAKVPKGVIQNRGLASIAPPERDILQEHVGLLRALPSAIPSFINRLIGKIAPSFKDPKEYLYIPSFKNLEFKNHGRTVRNTPAITCVPKTAQEIVEIVKYAKAKNMGVRVSGFRHSWSPVFGRSRTLNGKNNGDILISTLGLIDASILPNFTSLPTDLFQPEAKDLNSIIFVDHNYVKGPQLTNGKRYVRVGTSTTNEQLRRWCINTGKVTLPCQIIEVEITMGGSNATICHGAGINNPTLSDLVRAIEYVDANGVLRKIDSSTPTTLRAAAGCFGLIGVVTHLVLEFDKLACALMKPRKVPVIEAIPPPPELKLSDIPPPLRPKQPLTAARMAEIQRDFETRAITHFYSEWFWFPYSSSAWVNTWEKTDDTSNVVTYPSNVKTVLQVFGTIMMNIAQNATILLNITQKLPETQTKLLTWLAMKNLDDVGPNGAPIKAWIPDALHFQRGVQNIRVRDLEVEFPLQPKVNTVQANGSATPDNATTTQPSSSLSTRSIQTIDLTVVQRAWWDAILACYASIQSSPQRMPLEMRIMSDSQVTLAPQRGHALGTCAIEILTLHNVADIWPAYAQKVLDKWSSYRDADGALIPVRPHWAKEWYGYKYRGKPWEEVLRSEDSDNGGFRDEIREWQGEVVKLAARDGWKIESARKRFGNEALDRMFWTGVERFDGPAATAGATATTVIRPAAVAAKPVSAAKPAVASATNGSSNNGVKSNGATMNGTVPGTAVGTNGKNKNDEPKKKKEKPLKKILAKLKKALD